MATQKLCTHILNLFLRKARGISNLMARDKRTSLEASFASLMVFLMFSLLVKSFLVVLSDTFSTCTQALS